MYNRMIKNKLIIYFAGVCLMFAGRSIYAFDFNGKYIGTGNAIIELNISSNKVHAVAKCLPVNCDWTTNKISIINNGNTMVVELNPLENQDKSNILYTTMLLTPTGMANKIQVVLVSYRKFFYQTESSDYNSTSSAVTVLTKN